MMTPIDHWGRRPRDWAELAEPCSQPLFAAVLDELVTAQGTALLDVGCGSGYAAGMADGRGGLVTGIDQTPELLEIARERAPAARFVLADMEALHSLIRASTPPSASTCFSSRPIRSVRWARRLAW